MMKSTGGANPSAPWNEEPMHPAHPPTYAEAINTGTPHPAQMPQPYSQQPIPPYPVQQQPPYPVAPGIPVYSQANPEPVYQQYQSSEYTVPVVNHPTTHVQHIVTTLPTERPRTSDRKSIRVLLAVIFAFIILGAIIRAAVSRH